MKQKILYVVILLALMFSVCGFEQMPLRAKDTYIYILIGASNAKNGTAANAFIASMNSATGKSIIVLNCAVNNSGLNGWQPGENYYNNCLSKYRTIKNSGTLKGVLFINGEYEAKNGTPWAGAFDTLVAGLRADLGNALLPMVFARINPKMPGFYTDRTYQEQTDTAINLVEMINTDDLYIPKRVWHYKTPELQTIGQRMADTFLYPLSVQP